MTMTNFVYATAAIGFVLQIATLAVLGWLYLRTQVKPVLYNLLWQVFSLAWSFVSPLIQAQALNVAPGHPPTYSVPLFALTQMIAIVHIGLFVWMLVALVHWGNSNLSVSRKTIAPDPAV